MSTPHEQLDPTIYETIQKEKIAVGDVIYIEANSGAVKRQGRSDAFVTEFDLEVCLNTSSHSHARAIIPFLQFFFFFFFFFFLFLFLFFFFLLLHRN